MLSTKIYSFDEIVMHARTGLNPRQNFKLGNGTNYYITIKNIKNGKIVVDNNTDTVDDVAIKLIHKRSQIKKGDVLFASIGRIGDSCIIEEDPLNWDINESVFAFTLNTDIIMPKFFCYYLQKEEVKDYLTKSSSGSTFKSIKMNQLKQMSFDLPEIDEQEKIVMRLNALSEIVVMHEKQLEDLDSLVKSRFIEMFGDPSLNPYSYPVKNISDIADYWNGLTYKPDDVSVNGTIVLRSSNIQNGKLDFKDTVRVTCKIGDKKYVQNNDILMCSRNGSAKLVGKVALIDSLTEPMCFGAFMMIIRSNYYPYLLTYFNTEAFRRQLSVGATTTINQITGNMLSQIKLPVPPLEQVKEYLSFMAQVDKSKLAVQQSLDELETLKKSLMQQYFG